MNENEPDHTLELNYKVFVEQREEKGEKWQYEHLKQLVTHLLRQPKHLADTCAKLV